MDALYLREAYMSGAAFSADPIAIGGLLKSDGYRVLVPKFQRGYMWQRKHIEAFWDDLIKQDEIRQRTKGQRHFFGPIVTRTDDTQETVELLDGQQRLATATILFSVMRDVAQEIGQTTGISDLLDFASKLQNDFIHREDEDDTIVYLLRMGETDKSYFQETIQKRTPDLSVKPKMRTQRNIKAAREFLKTKIVSEVGPLEQVDAIRALARLKALRKTLSTHFIMAQIGVTSTDSAFRIFETLNHRGLRLSPPDLLLNYLMEKAVSDDDRTDIRALWTEMLQSLGTHDISRFMRHMWISKYGDLKKEDLFTALRKRIDSDPQMTAVDFALICSDECDNYVQLITYDEKALTKEVVPYVRAIQELNVQAAMPLLLSAFPVLTPGDFRRLIQYLLVFVVRYSIVGEMDSAGMEDLFYSLAREVRTTVKLKSTGDKDKVASQRCVDEIKGKLERKAPDKDSVDKRAANLNFEGEPADARYVVRRLANYVQSEHKLENEVPPSVTETNLEHIFPQSPKPTEWGGKQNHELLEPLLWHLGNLTIFGKRANRDASNKEYETAKRKAYETRTQVTMTKEIAKNFTTWNEQTIKERAESLAPLLATVWKFDDVKWV